MEKYKPSYLGKVIPADDQSKMTDFMQNKYGAFSKIYDSCKNQSEKISDVRVVDNGSSSSDSLSVKISADKEAVESIKEAAKDDSSVSVDGDVITAKGE